MPSLREQWLLSAKMQAQAHSALERAQVDPVEAIRALGYLSTARQRNSVARYRQELARHAGEIDLQFAVRRWTEQLDELSARLQSTPPEDGDFEESWLPIAERVLDERQRLEHLLRGLELLHQDHPSLGGVLRSLLDAGDLRLQTQLWRLTRINKYRQKKLEEIAPEHRGAMWWYSLGAHIPPSTINSLSDVAALFACFPEALDEVLALGDAEALLVALKDDSDAARDLGFPGQAQPEEALAAHHLARLPAISTDRRAEAEEGTAKPMKRRRRWSTFTLGGVGAALVVFLFGGSWILRDAQRQAEQERARLLEESQRLREEADANVRRLEEALKNRQVLSEAQHSAVESALEKAKQAAASAPSTESSTPGKARSSRIACAPGDPMCGGL